MALTKSEIQKRYYEKHKKENALRGKKWRKNNPEKCRRYSKKSYYKNIKKRRANSRNYYKLHKHECNRKGAIRRRLWRQKNREKAHSQSRKEKYGITEKQFQSMLKDQKGRCAICRCKEIIIDKNTGKVKTLSVDHNHKTNKIRKLLCHRCNLGIGIFKDSWKLLQAASSYLKSEEGTRNGRTNKAPTAKS